MLSDKTTDAVAPSLPVVGIGASAGGLEALQELLENMPTDTGMAFVIVTHQHPGHTSLLPELLGKRTGMPVVQAQDGMALEADHVFISPPGSHLALMNATLQLMEAPEGESPPLLIDFFFRSLAQDRQTLAICVILSGTGSDGTLGLQAVKGEGGMAIVQKPGSAHYDGMPSRAIETQMADYVLAPAAMPSQLVAYARSLSATDKHPVQGDESAVSGQSMQKIFVLLRNRTGHDFSSYKPSTMTRRIERRMTVHQLETSAQYVHLLQDNPHEIDLLFKELLIGVTRFFRDPDTFQALGEAVLPELIAARPDDDVFRVWVPGCSSGEEAYTLAILLCECMRKRDKTFEFQIFASDMDLQAIEKARSGRYPAGIAADVPHDLLQRYFIEEDDSYRVCQEIREMLVFASHNIIKDPPFTRLDLLSCRNLLIYLNPDLQKRLFPIFHYALKPDGILVLGSSETVGGFDDLFETLDRNRKIYRRLDASPARPLLALPSQLPAHGSENNVSATGRPETSARFGSQVEKLLLNRFAPSSVVINQQGDIVYLHGRTGMYLEPSAGHPRMNIHDMARNGLRIELASALRQASAQDGEIVRRNTRVRTNGDYTHVDLAVVRLSEPETLRGLLLVTFRPAAAPPKTEAASDKEPVRREPAGSGDVSELERELEDTKASLQTTVEKLEMANEDLQSTNEELQSTNEELQSSNEELETSKEEMQSLNEELTTVNSELQTKVDDLSHANDDMQNLLNSTDIATLFVDNDLNIKRYTDQARKIVKLIPSDIGRPLGDLVSNLRYEGLAENAAEVLRTLVPRETQMEDKDGIWYLMRILPYRTGENQIDGLVITFVDISATKAAEANTLTWQASQALLQSIFDTIQIPALVLDDQLRVAKANRAFDGTFSTQGETTENQSIYALGNGQWNLPELRELLEKVIPRKRTIDDFKLTVRFPGGAECTYLLNARRLERETGMPGMILLTTTPDTGRAIR